MATIPPFINNRTISNGNDCTFLKVYMPIIYSMPQINQIALNFIFTSVYYLEAIEGKKSHSLFSGFWLLSWGIERLS